MKRKNLARIAVLVVSVILLLSTALSLTSCTIANAQDAVDGQTIEGFFRELSDVMIDKTQYYAGTSIQKLPSNVKDEDEISVIVQFNTKNLLEAYNEIERDISFSEYILTEEAEEIKAGIELQKKEITSKLDKKGIRYEVGADYNVLLSGFEIVIFAEDFETTAKSFGSKATALVSEVYNVSETKLVENAVNVDESTGIFNSAGFDYDGSGMTDADPNENETPTTDTYFASTILSRDQARDEALAVLQTVLENEDALEETKTQALSDISRIALEIEKEANIESLIRARGFEDCIAVLSGDAASIIVKSDTELLQNHVAQISEIVYEQSGVLPSNVKIICK